MASVCNFDCICIDSDCRFYHPFSLQERKNIKKIYDAFTNINKNEPNPEIRKANCKFGKLCNNPNCGYRHRLSYDDRIKLIKAYDNSKLDATKIKKEQKSVTLKVFTLENKNLFNSLDIEELHELPDEVSVIIEKPQCNVLKWADMADDDDFYMKF